MHCRTRLQDAALCPLSEDVRVIQCLEPGTLAPSGFRTVYAAVDDAPFFMDGQPAHASLAHPAVALEEEDERVLLDGSIDANLTLVPAQCASEPCMPLYLRFNDSTSISTTRTSPTPTFTTATRTCGRCGTTVCC